MHRVTKNLSIIGIHNALFIIPYYNMGRIILNGLHEWLYNEWCVIAMSVLSNFTCSTACGWISYSWTSFNLSHVVEVLYKLDIREFGSTLHVYIGEVLCLVTHNLSYNKSLPTFFLRYGTLANSYWVRVMMCMSIHSNHKYFYNFSLTNSKSYLATLKCLFIQLLVI